MFDLTTYRMQGYIGSDNIRSNIHTIYSHHVDNCEGHCSLQIVTRPGGMPEMKGIRLQGHVKMLPTLGFRKLNPKP